MTERSIFLAALDMSDPARRALYLDHACAGDAELRRRVEALLEAHAEPGRFLESPAVILDATADLEDEGLTEPPADRPAASPFIEGPGTTIGPYKLREKIGEGGMGVVYMAEQEHPIRRRVALKIIKPGMDTDQVIARFEAERQALALMDHQHIARVLDAGTTGSGRPYFVMELVRGVPITDYCDQNRLTPRERLELFVPVCQAIQHAHQKGIIHRDVKPSNVMVTLHDGKPVPKAIDFGVAKAIDQKLTERTMFTQLGAIIGTWEYMSPEQAGMSGLDIDTKSDIYSLGVLLYELLTGSPPLQRAKLREAAYSEILRRVREEEPPKPSTRLSESKDTLPALSAQRKTEPAKLAKLVQGDLDWIVMKSLEKDRTRRYETANALARDIERHLHDEPVEAGPPSAGYRLRKFARKYRTPLRLVAAFGLLLIVAAALSTWQAVRATRAERAVRKERDRVVAAEAESRAVNDFLQNDLLAKASSWDQGGSMVPADPDIKVRTVLDRASQRIEGKFDGQPLVEASIRQTIGVAYSSLGQYDQAEYHLERARSLRLRELGEAHPKTLRSTNALFWLRSFQQGKALDLATVEKLLSLTRRVLGDEDPDTVWAMGNLGLLLFQAGRVGEAEQLLSTALEVSRRVLGEADIQTIETMIHLGSALASRGKYAEAELLMTKALEVSRRALGEHHPTTTYPMINLGQLYLSEGKLDQAEPLLNRADQVIGRVLGGEHPYALFSAGYLGSLYQAQGKFDKADVQFTKSLAGFRRTLGEAHPATQQAMNNLAWFLVTVPDQRRRNPARAVELAGKLVSAAPRAGAYRNTLGVAQYRAGDWKRAIESLEESMELREGGDSLDWFFLAMAHLQVRNREKARQWFDQAVEWMERKNPQDPQLLGFRAEAAALLGIKDHADSKGK